MKKRFCFLLVFILLITSGCAKASVSMEIKKDKSMVLTIINAEKSSYVDLDGNVVKNDTELSEEDKKNYEDNGFYIQRYVEDDLVGYQFTKNINNIDEYSTDTVLDSKTASENLLLKNEPLFTIEHTFFKNKYKANFNLSSLTKYYNNNYLNNSGNYVSSALSNDLDLSFNLTLPYKYLSSNATSISEDGKTLEWDLSKISNVEFEFVIYDMTRVYIVGGIGIFFLLSFLFSIIRFVKKNSKPDYKKMYNKEKYDAIISQTAADIQTLNTNVQPIYETNTNSTDIENINGDGSTTMFAWENTELQNNNEVINSNDVFASPNINNVGVINNNDSFNSINNNSGINFSNQNDINSNIQQNNVSLNNDNLSSIAIPAPLPSNNSNQIGNNNDMVSHQNETLYNNQINNNVLQQPVQQMPVIEQPINQVSMPIPVIPTNNSVPIVDNSSAVPQAQDVVTDNYASGGIIPQQPIQQMPVVEQPINQVSMPIPVIPTNNSVPMVDNSGVVPQQSFNDSTNNF